MVSCVAPAAFAQVVISDNDFNGIDWSADVSAVNGASHAVSQPSIGGNPGQYRNMHHLMPPFSGISVLHMYAEAIYDPSFSGAISSIDYREDRIETNPPYFGAAVGARPALTQNGVTYYASDITYTHTQWNTVQLDNLAADDFTDFATPVEHHPDFSSSGSSIQFGYLRSNFNTGSVSIVIEHGIDNWSVTIHQVPTGVKDRSPGAALRIAGPNPFSHFVGIEVVGSGRTIVTVHDVAGRLVRTLFDRDLTHAYSTSWDGTDQHGVPISSGIYFIQLRAKGIVETRKVVVVR